MSLKPTGRSGDGITSNFKYNCFMCPNKGFIRIEEAIHVQEVAYSNKMAHTFFVFCCGAFVDDHTLPNAPTNGADPSSPADNALNEADLDKKYLPLWNLMKHSLSIITTTINYYNDKCHIFRTPEFEQQLQLMSNMDIIALTETWLDENIETSELDLDKCNVFRCD
ncbi:hypothetical protein HHI36_013411 [Cryptolaemus montrouzieri]|uniref:Uncharacterized protein n=1 Tax=Cryptolaemus montrouzieri TaxID=559131 RepID=A0ABD2NI77_9CUCU